MFANSISSTKGSITKKKRKMKRILSGCREKQEERVCRMDKRKYRILFGILLMLVFCGGCTDGSAPSDSTIHSTDTAMGTIVRQTVYVDGQEGITSDILNNITDLECNFLSWRLESSELYRANEAAGREEGFRLSEELSDILVSCMEVSDASEGAFDVTIGEVVRLWDIDEWTVADQLSDFVIPDAQALAEGLEYSGYDKLKLQDNTLFLPDGMQLDLGAVGKGIALDYIREYLEGQDEASGAVISVGGSVLTYGSKPDGKPWRVGVVNPMDTSQNLGYLTLHGQWCVSTSGDYERYVELDGVRYHHILDPATGFPADSGVSSVTILAKDGLLSDALSTACFVLGSRKGTILAEQFGAEALFVDKNGNITMTKGMEKFYN